jgi:FkbM family methyltransferase
MQKATVQNRLASIVYLLLVRTARFAESGRFSQYWNKLWRKSCTRFQCQVSTTIHGKSVIVNFGFTYPIYARRFPSLNAPLVELAYQTWKSKVNPIFFVDVGAAVGDTVLLLYANLPGAFCGFVCVDGDPEFYGYLEKNLRHLPEGRLVNSLLSGAEEEILDLVRTHTGTASAQSQVKRTATTLSELISEEVDLLKIDVDGFDGRVLSGASDLLQRCHPSVIFEWHPILCQQTGNNWTDHFRILTAAGYSRFVWFTKFGDFSHFMMGFSQSEVNALAEYCLVDIPADWHYDVVALHDTSNVSAMKLAKLRFAATRPSCF